MELMEIRRALMMGQQCSVIPAAYQPIEWLQSSGTQYIATEYSPGLDLTVKWRYMFTDSITGDKMIFGSTTSASNNKRLYAEYYESNRWYAGCNLKRYGGVLARIGYTINTVYDAMMDGNSLVVDGNSASPTATNNDATLPNLYIFAWNYNGNVQHLHNALRLYYLTIEQSGKKAADFIPCIRKSDSKPGMYDTVSKTFYTNAGTGEFIVPT